MHNNFIWAIQLLSSPAVQFAVVAKELGAKTSCLKEWTAVSESVDELAEIKDPAERARLAGEELAKHQSLVTRLAKVRRQAVSELRASGMSYAEVGKALGVTRGRIAQMGADSHALERAFFGSPDVTIVTPLRNYETERPLLAQEDYEAASKLSNFLTKADINVEATQSSPKGKIDLSPEAMVVICGPKSSPQAAELIATDPFFEFKTNEQGHWQIVERSTGWVFGSPIDKDPPEESDIAYVARLPRGEGQRPVLLIAGIHAIGSLGAITHLTNMSRLPELHNIVGDSLFSMIVQCQFTRSPLAITETTALTPPRIQQP